MSLLKLIKNSILGLLNSGSGSEYVYDVAEETRGKMTLDEVLGKVAPLIAEENLNLAKKESLVKPYRPTLQENTETGHRQWLVTILYERLNGKLLNGDEQIECFWVIVDDESREISKKIYPRQKL